jgi:hypothetical protein
MGKEIAREHGKIFVQDDSLFLGTDDQKLLLTLKEGTRVRLGRAILTFSFISYPIDIDHLEVAHSSSGLDKWINTRVIIFLYCLFVLMVFLSAPNHFRSSDASKELLKLLMGRSFLLPFSGFMSILLFRKFNRGEYSWKKSVFFTLLFSLIAIFIALIEKLFCWFEGFSVFWNIAIANFVFPVLMFFLWFNAVGKEAPQKLRLIRSIWITVIVLALAYSVHVLSTGYSSEFQIESCSSLTGWHWGSGEALSQWQSWLDKVKLN